MIVVHPFIVTVWTGAAGSCWNVHFNSAQTFKETSLKKGTVVARMHHIHPKLNLYLFIFDCKIKAFFHLLSLSGLTWPNKFTKVIKSQHLKNISRKTYVFKLADSGFCFFFGKWIRLKMCRESVALSVQKHTKRTTTLSGKCINHPIATFLFLSYITVIADTATIIKMTVITS